MKKRCFPLTDRKMKKDRWNQYYADFDMQQYLELLEYDETTRILDKCTAKLSKDIAVLDVGCGPGRHLIHLFNNGFTNLTGLDLSEEGIKRLNEYNPKIKAEVGDATKLPYSNNSFDLIVMVGIVYEIEDNTLHPKVFEEIKRVLKDDGLCFFVNNSPYNLGERLYTVTSFVAETLKHCANGFFVWRYSYADVKKIVRKSGLFMEQEIPCNHRRGIYRFLYGIFVTKKSLKQREYLLEKNNANTYRIHEYYTVNKDTSLLNCIGRLVDRICALTFMKKIFANTVCYRLTKDKE